MANMSFGVNIVPTANNTYALGNSNNKWTLYVESINGETFIHGIPFGICQTSASTQDKALTISGIESLHSGLSIRVLFSNAQSYNGTPKLNLNSLGAVKIYRSSNAEASYSEWVAGEVIDLVYYESKWIIVGGNRLSVG